MPGSVGRRSISAQNIEIAVIGPDSEISIGRSVPLVQYFLDHVLVPVQPKANRPFVCYSTGIAIHLPASYRLLFPSLSSAWKQITWLDPTWMADMAEPKQLTAASAPATPIFSGETHADPCRHLHVYAASQCGARKPYPLIVPRPTRRRPNSVSTSLPDAARALSGTNPGNHGCEQAVVVGKQCKRCRRVSESP